MKLGHESQHRKLRVLQAQAANEVETGIRIAAIDNRESDRLAVFGDRGIGQPELGMDRNLESGAHQQAKKPILSHRMLAEQKCFAAATMDEGAVIG